MTAIRAIVVANPKTSGGAERRTESIKAILESLGYAVEVFQPKINRRRPPTRSELRLLAQGGIVPEALSWNVGDAADYVSTVCPDLVVLQTARAVHPLVVGQGPTTVLDLVDQLSTSYRQRAAQSGPAVAQTLRLLAKSHQRFENRRSRLDLPILTAGYREAATLGVTWIPNVIDAPIIRQQVSWAERTYDAVFFGTLSYQPNIEAILQFNTWATEIRWSGSVLIAGRFPSEDIKRICRTNGWRLAPDFPSVSWLADNARVAIAPLRSTAGIQNKVLEAGQVGLAQVVTSAAIAGVDPGMPLIGADNAADFFGQLDQLLANPETATEQVAAMQDYLNTNLVAAAVAPKLLRLLEDSSTDRRLSSA